MPIYNKEKGITLIAIVVTIVAILILAGVTVGMISGGGDIVEKAYTAKEETEITSGKEILNQYYIEALRRR